MKRIPNKFRNQPGYGLKKAATVRWLNGETYASIASEYGTSIDKVRHSITKFLESVQKAMREVDVMTLPESYEEFIRPFINGRNERALRDHKHSWFMYIDILEGEQYVDRGSLGKVDKGHFSLDIVDKCPGCHKEFIPDAFSIKARLCPICNKGLMQLASILKIDDEQSKTIQ